MNPKQNIFVTYINYLDNHFEHFRKHIEDTCTKKLLAVPKDIGLVGITLLVFKNSKLVSKFDDMINGFDTEDLDRATEIMKSCIIYGHYPTVNSFKYNKDQIVTSAMKLLKIDNIANDHIMLSGGVKITPDIKFQKEEPSASKVAIWHIEEGFPMYSDIPFDNSGTVKKRAGRETKEPERNSNQVQRRGIIFDTMLSAFQTYVGQSKKMDLAKRLPLIEYAASLILYIMTNHPDLLPDIMSVCNMSNTDILFLMEPQTIIDPIISDEIINKWWSCKKSASIIDVYTKAFNAVKDSANCFAKRHEIVAHFDSYRKKNIADRFTFENVIKLYDGLEKTNTVFGIDNVYPPRIYERYKKYPNLKLNEDDRRLCWGIKFVWYDRDRNYGKTKDLDSIMDSVYNFNKHKNALTQQSTFIMNAYRIKQGLDADALKNLILPTYNSNSFIYVAGIEPLKGYKDDAYDSSIDGLIDINSQNVKVINSVYSDPSNLYDVRELDIYGIMGIKKQNKN